jgi:hypothetical protein
MRLRLFALLLAALAPVSLRADIGTIDVKPAATLLFPYFEVDLGDTHGRTTIITIQAATPTATLAHVTLWTDLAVPIYAFDVYLTGYDMQAINLRDVFNGTLPYTADDGEDPSDTGRPWDGISNQGQFSQDINYPGSTGPCGAAADYLITPALLADLRAAHTGQALPSTGLFAGRDLGDNIARGFLTVDVVTQCTPQLPNEPGYFTGVTHTGNWLFGEYLLINLADNFMQSETAVHIEASDSMLGQRTFYGRLANAAGGVDKREPLPSRWALPALTDQLGAPDNQLMVWRDPGVEIAPFAVPSVLPAPFPMPVSDATAFDDESRVTTLPTSLAPFATTSTRLVPNLFDPGTKLGWAFLDLNVGSNPADVRQSWVTVGHTWEGRYSTATNGVVLDAPLASLRLLGASCVGGTVQLVDDGFPRLLLQGCASPFQLSYRLRLVDTVARSVTGLSSGTWAGPPPQSIKTTLVTPGEFDTSDIWGLHEPGGNSFPLQFFVPGGPPAQSLTFQVWGW